jgi:molybdenum cofactor biosynthesis enzyme
MSKLTHFDVQNQAHMVDISVKLAAHCIAVAKGTIHIQHATLKII